MSSFDTLESGLEGSQPIELYEFLQGTLAYRYTSSEDSVTLGGNVYSPESITRTSVLSGAETKSRMLEITVPITNAFASQYSVVVPGQRATLNLTKLQRNESPSFATQVLHFRGRVRSVRFPNDREAIILLSSAESAGSRPIPSYTYQKLCNHVLYGRGCNVDSSLFKHTGVVSTASGNTITVNGASAFASQYFRGGFVKPSGFSDFRMVLDHTGNVLTLLLPFSVNVVNQSVDVFAGCDHQITGHCSTRFNNVIEYGGFAFVPVRNPFTQGVGVQ